MVTQNSSNVTKCGHGAVFTFNCKRQREMGDVGDLFEK